MTGQNRLNYNIRRSAVASYNSGSSVITLGSAVSGYLGITSGIPEGQWFTFGVVKADGSLRATLQGLYSATSGSGSTPGITIVNDEDDTSTIDGIDNTCEVFTTVSAGDVNDMKVHFASSPPTGSGIYQGKLWWDTRNHELYVYYWDGSTAQWISAHGFSGSLRTSGGDGFLDLTLRRVGGQIADTGNNWAGGSSCRSGDLLVIFNYRDGSTTLPTTPSGYTSITSTAGNTNCMRVSAKIATADDETPQSATNATESHFHVFRGHRQRTTGGTVSDAIGAFAGNNGSGTTVTLKGLSTTESPGNCMCVAMAGHRSTDADFGDSDPLKLILWGDDNTTDGSGGYLSNRNIDDFADASVGTIGTSSGWASITIEIRAASIVERDIGSVDLGDMWAGRRWDGEKYTTVSQQAISASWAGYEGEGGISTQTMTGLCGVGNLSNDDNRTVLILEHRLSFDLYPCVVSGFDWTIDGGTNQIHGVRSSDTNRAYINLMIDNKGGGGTIGMMASFTGGEWAYNTQDYAA